MGGLSKIKYESKMWCQKEPLDDHLFKNWWQNERSLTLAFKFEVKNKNLNVKRYFNLCLSSQKQLLYFKF